MGKRSQRYIHLLQNIGVAAVGDNGGGEVKVDQVPGNSPHVVVEIGSRSIRFEDNIGDLFDLTEAVRKKIVDDLIVAGFNSFGGPKMDARGDAHLLHSVFVKEAEDGWRIVKVNEVFSHSGTPRMQLEYSESAKDASMEYWLQNSGRSKGHRQNFISSFEQSATEQFWRQSAQESFARSIMHYPPFRVSYTTMEAVRKMFPDRAHDLARVLASQTLESENDLLGRIAAPEPALDGEDAPSMSM